MAEILDCKHECEPEGISTGYARTQDGRKICLRCAEREEIEEIKTQNDYVVYISRDHKSITTWTGAKLGTVTKYSVSKPRWSNYGPVHRHYIRVTDIHGGYWYGSGPVENGEYVTLHRAK